MSTDQRIARHRRAGIESVFILPLCFSVSLRLCGSRQQARPTPLIAARECTGDATEVGSWPNISHLDRPSLAAIMPPAHRTVGGRHGEISLGQLQDLSLGAARRDRAA